jgi:hypothetical protein
MISTFSVVAKDDENTNPVYQLPQATQIEQTVAV